MKILLMAFCLFTASAFVMSELPQGQAEARKRRRKRKRKAKKPKATKKTYAGVSRLMGKFKWGMSSSKVLSMLQDRVRASEQTALNKIKDPIEQDRRRKEMMENVKKIRKDFVKFVGKRTPWDVSLVDKEFAHRNNESMALIWKKRERRFFFFHHDRLYKIFIAFNADLFQGKTFEDFAQAMEGRFGPAQRKFSMTLKGDAKMDHLAWPRTGRTQMLAYDYTGFYGNFCLVLIDMETWDNVKSGRKVNSPKRKYNDPLVDAVTKPSNTDRDQNADIIDRITGKGNKVPPMGSGGSTSSPPPSAPGSSTPDYSKPKRGGKKLNPNNPLQGLDL